MPSPATVEQRHRRRVENGGCGSTAATYMRSILSVSRCTPQQVELARAQVARATEFREHLEHYWQACERWADTELEAVTAYTEVGKKGASKRCSRRKTAEIEALSGPGAVDGLDLEAIGTAARRRALQLAARAVERCLNACASDHAGATYDVTAERWPVRRPPREDVQSALGPLRLERAY